ncbi:MAG TPA: 4-alpha-glucanotransferase, partial [Bacteroidales bacterium]|nr:4-alpha-glucanotransferase [Bacteroidales bacterium]
ENDFDIIHAHDWLAYPAGIAAKNVSGKPLVIHVHATDFDRSGGSVNPVVYNIEKAGMDAADRIITVSNLTRETVIHNYRIDPSKVMTVYNAVEPVGGVYDEYDPRAINDKVVTFLGRITMQKGPEYFIEAAYRVLQVMNNVRFVMAGSGDMMERMIKRAAALNITDRFHFTGFLRGMDVYWMLRLSDVYIMPSVSEPFGISPLEAMQSNVPVIISKQSGVSEILTHAVKIDFWDIDAMADAIHAILTYPALSKMFIEKGRQEVETLKWENSARHVRDVYLDVMN